jgi:hypothetical protein
MRKNCTRTEDERATQRVGPFRKNLWATHKGKGETTYIGGISEASFHNLHVNLMFTRCSNCNIAPNDQHLHLNQTEQ